MRWFVFVLCCALHAVKPDIPKVKYEFSKEPIDVVIPCIRKDLLTLEKCIEGIRKNGKDVRRVIVLSGERLSGSAEWFDENSFPFSRRDLAIEIFGGDVAAAEEFMRAPNTRISWIYQQLLKFYVPFVIPEISSNVLILDADVIFLNPVEFVNSMGGPYFIPAREYMPAYFAHAARLVTGLRRVHAQHSGIAHHMLFQRVVLEDLFALIVKQHGVEPWKAMCRCVDREELFRSCMSEYEIYFNFVLLRSDQGVVHPLKWEQVHSLHNLAYYQRMGYVYVACPEWFRALYGQ